MGSESSSTMVLVHVSLFLVNSFSYSFSIAYKGATTPCPTILTLFILIRSICVSSALACPWWETDELATWLKVANQSL